MIRSEVAVHQDQSVLLQQPVHGKGVILDVRLLVGINEDDVKLLPPGLHLLHLLVCRADYHLDIVAHFGLIEALLC